MVKAWRETNTFNTLYVLPVTASSGTAAVYTLTATVAESPSAGTVCLYIGGQRIAVDVTPATTAATLHTAIAAKISASPDLPVTALSNDDSVVITAKAKGEVGNDIDISLNYYTGEDLPQGVTVSIEGEIMPELGTGRVSIVLTEELSAERNLVIVYKNMDGKYVVAQNVKRDGVNVSFDAENMVSFALVGTPDNLWIYIAAGVGGGVALILIIAIVVIVLRKKKKKNEAYGQAKSPNPSRVKKSVGKTSKSR